MADIKKELNNNDIIVIRKACPSKGLSALTLGRLSHQSGQDREARRENAEELVRALYPDYPELVDAVFDDECPNCRQPFNEDGSCNRCS